MLVSIRTLTLGQSVNRWSSNPSVGTTFLLGVKSGMKSMAQILSDRRSICVHSEVRPFVTVFPSFGSGAELNLYCIYCGLCVTDQEVWDALLSDQE
jgi:hypothetical protein